MKNNILSVNTEENISDMRLGFSLLTEISCVADKLNP
jgi:hypothetical protein